MRSLRVLRLGITAHWGDSGSPMGRIAAHEFTSCSLRNSRVSRRTCVLDRVFPTASCTVASSELEPGGGFAARVHRRIREQAAERALHCAGSRPTTATGTATCKRSDIESRPASITGDLSQSRGRSRADHGRLRGQAPERPPGLLNDLVRRHLSGQCLKGHALLPNEYVDQSKYKDGGDS